MVAPYDLDPRFTLDSVDGGLIASMRQGAFAPVIPAITQVMHHSERYLPLVRDYNAAMHLGHMASYREALRYAYGRRVLDIGCGVGYGAFFLASNGATKVVALDLGPEALSYADCVYNHANLTYLQGDGMSLPFADGSFDFIFSSQVIEHVPSAEIFMREIKRVLAPQGFCLITAPNLNLFSPTGVSDNEFHLSEMDWNTYQAIARRVFPATQFRGIPQHCLYFNSDLKAVITKPNSQIQITDYIPQDHHLEVCENMLCFGFNDTEGNLSSLLPDDDNSIARRLEPLYWDPSQHRWVVMTRYPADDRLPLTLTAGQRLVETIVSDHPGLYRVECDVLQAHAAQVELKLCAADGSTLAAQISTVGSGDTLNLLVPSLPSGTYELRLDFTQSPSNQPLVLQSQPIDADQKTGVSIDGVRTAQAVAIRTFVYA